MQSWLGHPIPNSLILASTSQLLPTVILHYTSDSYSFLNRQLSVSSLSMSTTSTTSSIRSQLGPLTTTFSRPSDCSSLLWYTHSYGWYGYPANTLQCRLEKYSTSGSVTSKVFKRAILAESCFPPGFASFINQWTATDPLAPPSPYETVHFYSPGLVCPAGYTTACAVARQTDLSLPPGAPGGIWSLLSPGETAIGCCPR